jgi:threonine/homoserine/homoserine lactone efflux protein
MRPVLGEAIGGLLPSAIAVALSPIPIVGVILVLGSPRAKASGAAFALGWIAGLAVLSTLVVLLLGSGVDHDTETGIEWFKVAIGVVFLAMAAKQWRKRPRDGEKAAMPGWMESGESITAPRAAALGAALSGANPKNLALTLAASASISEAGLDGLDSALAILVYVALGSITVAGAVLFYLVSPARAGRPLQAVGRFMEVNSAVIMMVVLLLLGAKLLGDGLGGVSSL